MSLVHSAYIKKTIERLRGIIEGIAIDEKITDEEVAQLHKWLDIHIPLHEVEPFKGLKILLLRCLEDGNIDQFEREDIMDWCDMFIGDSPFPFGITAAIRRLHGILSGINIDDIVEPDEIVSLQEWLDGFEQYKTSVYPFNELFPLLEDILADGKVELKEKEDLKAFCGQFSEQIAKNPELYDDIYLESWMKTASPIFEPLLSFCEKNHKIHFYKNTFCFTGPARAGKRKDLHKIVEKCGGYPLERTTLLLDYLIIGAQSSPAWVYSTYGRKIERIIHERQRGRVKTLIIHEDDFISQSNGLLLQK